MMTDVMTGVIKNGTGRGLGLDNMISAGKTGTTNDKKDGWFVGYTPYYTTGVWVGYDIPKSTSGLSGASYPGTIWKTYMNVIHKGLENIAFPVYTDNRTDAEKAEDQGITPTPTDTPTPTPTDTPTPTPTDTPTPTPEDPDDWEDGWEEPGLTEAPTNPDTTEGGEEGGSGSDDGQNNGGVNGDEGSGTGDGETDFATP